MTDLKVDYATLDAAHQSLERIAAELEGADHRCEELAGVWGSPDVAGAMGSFAGNWDRHREKLLESVRSVGEMCAGTTETFRGCEQGLSDVLTDR
jgi:hypothetical protein